MNNLLDVPILLAIGCGLCLIAWWRYEHVKNAKRTPIQGIVVGYKQFPNDDLSTNIVIAINMRWLQVVEFTNPFTQLKQTVTTNPGRYRPAKLGTPITIRGDPHNPNINNAWVENGEDVLLKYGTSMIVLTVALCAIFSLLELVS